MKLIRCNNGHYYDAEKFSSCPHCNPGGASDEGTMPFTPQGVGFGGANAGDDAVTGSFYNISNGAVGTAGSSRSGAADINPTTPISSFMPDDEGKTVGIPFMKMGDGETQISPVVGWLVCTQGSNLGKSYVLKAGRNFIGRSKTMDVVLEGDRSVSRERHAVIIYDPVNRDFYAQPGDSQELFYVNGKVVLSSMKLFDRDKIAIGETTLIFVPFCNLTFSWADLES